MAQEPKDVLVRMNEELQRALEKASEDRRWVMVVFPLKTGEPDL